MHVLKFAVQFPVLLCLATCAEVAVGQSMTPRDPSFGGDVLSAVGGGPMLHDGHVHGRDCISRIDRVRIQEDIARYVDQFGPLSTSEANRMMIGGGALQFPIFPIGGSIWNGLYISNFVDLDASSGLRDWGCTEWTYNGHKGSDTFILGWDQQMIGVPITAALDGVVVGANDGEPDMNTEWDNQPANYVIVDHGAGRLCYYWHMKRGSVAVAPGESVLAGQQLGLVASSGNSTGPHLHFETRDSNVVVEPFEGECQPSPSQWEHQFEIQEQTELMDFMVTTVDLSDWYENNDGLWRPPHENQVPLDHQSVRLWMQGMNLPQGSTTRTQFFMPSGVLDYDSGDVEIGFSDQDYRYWWLWQSWSIADMHLVTGTWRIDFSINGEQFFSIPVEVVSEVDPAFNRPPRAVQALFEPAAPSVDDVITCRLITQAPLGDLDWDIVRYRYVWRVDGAIVRDVVTAGRSDHLPRPEASAGTTVSCEVTPTDGLLDGTSVLIEVDLSVGCPDLNGDGIVNGVELSMLLASWGGSDSAVDFDGSGLIDGADLTVVLSSWGDCSR